VNLLEKLIDVIDLTYRQSEDWKHCRTQVFPAHTKPTREDLRQSEGTCSLICTLI